MDNTTDFKDKGRRINRCPESDAGWAINEYQTKCWKDGGIEYTYGVIWETLVEKMGR